MNVLLLAIKSDGPDPETGGIVEAAYAAYNMTDGLIVCGSWVFDPPGGARFVGPQPVRGMTPEIIGTAGETAVGLFGQLEDAIDCIRAMGREIDHIVVNGVDPRWLKDPMERLNALRHHRDELPELKVIDARKTFEWPAGQCQDLTDLALMNGVGVRSVSRAIHEVLTVVDVLDALSLRGYWLEDLVVHALEPRSVLNVLVPDNDPVFVASLRAEGFVKEWSPLGFLRWRREIRSSTLTAWSRLFPGRAMWLDSSSMTSFESVSLTFRNREQAKSRGFSWWPDEKVWVIEVPDGASSASLFGEGCPFMTKGMSRGLSDEIREGALLD